jgi:inhibitor of cysteine peptidase
MKKIWLLLLLASIFLAACGEETPAAKVTDPQQPVTVSAGKEFAITLEANPTTGYHWAIVGDLDLNVVEFLKNDYISTSDPNLVGGGGLDIWTFKAVHTGEAQVTLGYYPPSNDPVDPQQTTTFTVIVQ